MRRPMSIRRSSWSWRWLIGWAEGEAFAPPSLRSWGVLLALAAFGHCLSWVLISRAMGVLPVALAGLLLLAQPIVAYLLDVVFLDVTITPRQWAGLAVSLAVFVWMYLALNWREIGNILLRSHLWVLLPSLVLMAVQFLARSIRWRYLLADGDGIPLRERFDA